MKRPGFSVTTMLLVAVLLGAVAWVGSIVNPVAPKEADHDHETEQAQPAANNQAPAEVGKDAIAKSDSPDRKKFMDGELKQRKEMMKKVAQTVKAKAGDGQTAPATSIKDPEAIDPNSNIFFKSEMGAEGIQKQEAEISKLKKEFEAAKAREKKSPYGIMISPDSSKEAGQIP